MSVGERQKSNIRRPIFIWVDSNVEFNQSDTSKTLARLHELIDKVELVGTPAKCIELLNKVDPATCYIIISGSLGKELIPQIHVREHVEAIFVFCRKRNLYEQWAKQWAKIRGVHTQIHSICDHLHPIIKQVENDDIAMSIITNGDNDCPNLRQLPPSFMYTSMLKDIFMIMKFEQEHYRNMITKLLARYDGNDKETRLIDEFSNDYRPEKAIWWYTRQCFTYRDINQSLRLLDVDLIVDMAPFMVDLHKQIQRLRRQQSDVFGQKAFTVYRGQGMNVEEFRKLNKSPDRLISFNSFLSTTTQRGLSLDFANGGTARSGHVGVLFVIHIDPSIHVVPFVQIREHSYFPDEDEILFAMHSIFKIGTIASLPDHKNLYQVELYSTDEEDPKLLELKKHMVGKHNGIPENRLGWILLDMGENDKAEEIYSNLLKKTVNERQKGVWNHQLGCIKVKQGSYQEAIEYYRKALDIYTTILSPDDSEIATTSNCIGSVYHRLGNYSDALLNHQKSLEIRKKTLPENHSSLANSYNNIGSVYKNMGDYQKALTNYEISLEIYKKSLPENHPDLATSYNNIGLVYSEMGDYQKALTNYEKSIEIRKKTLPENHPEIAQCYNNLGVLFYQMKRHKRALEYLEQARRILMISLSPTHPNLKTTNNWIEIVRKNV